MQGNIVDTKERLNAKKSPILLIEDFSVFSQSRTLSETINFSDLRYRALIISKNFTHNSQPSANIS